MNDKQEPEKKKKGLMSYLKKDVTAPVSEFMPELERGIFSTGTKDVAKGMAAFLTSDLSLGGRSAKIKNATPQTLLGVVGEVTQKGNKLTHGELDLLLKIATDTPAEKQTLILLQNTREPEKYPNKNLVVSRVQADDIVPVLALLRKLDQQSQAVAITRKVNPADVKAVFPFLLPLLDKNLRLTLINKCPVTDLAALFESFRAMPITKEEVGFLRKSKLRPGVILLIFNAVDRQNYSPELIHWAVNHTVGEDIHALYQKTHAYLKGVLHLNEHADDHDLVVKLFKLMFMNIAPNVSALTRFVQSPAPSTSDLASLNNVFSLLEQEAMLICTSSNANEIFSKFLKISYEVCCLAGKKELFDRERESAVISSPLPSGLQTPPSIVKSSAGQLLDGYVKAYGFVLTRYKRDQFPQFFDLARLLNEIAQTFR